MYELDELPELNVLEAISKQYKEVVAVIGIEATKKLHRAFNGRRILCVRHLYDLDYIVDLALKKKSTKYVERLVFHTGYSFDWLKKQISVRRAKDKAAALKLEMCTPDIPDTQDIDRTGTEED